MASFEPDADLSNDLAFRLMMNMFVTLFWRESILVAATGWLDRHGYQVTRFDASHWNTEDDLHRDISRALGFPDYYGRNLDALNDCMVT